MLNFTDLILFGTFLLIVVLFVKNLIQNHKNEKCPPYYSGWIPWLGCAIEFGKQPLDFINQKQKELGPVFSIKVAGECMTFLTDPNDIKLFFQSPNCLDFQKAVQTSVQNVASISKKSFFKYHSSIHDLVKGKLASSQLPPMIPKLYTEFQEQLSSLPDNGKIELSELVRYLMYKPVLNCLFGKDNLPVQKEYDVFTRNFVKFDEQFEYGAKLPAVFIQDWSKARKYLMDIFKNLSKSLQLNHDEDNKMLVESLLNAIDDSSAPNFSLMFMWAVLANGIPVTFWTLAFILSRNNVYEKVLEEIKDMFPSNMESAVHNNPELNKMVYLKSCILETVRLRSPGVIPRYAVKPFQIRDYTVPVGQRVFASPFWAHRNAEYFPDPDTFKPERWNMKDVERNIFPEYFFAFGGGRYQCPGRWFGLMEIQIFVIMFLKQFTCQANDPVPPPSFLHVVGTQQPDGPYTLHYQRRDIQ